MMDKRFQRDRSCQPTGVGRSPLEGSSCLPSKDAADADIGSTPDRQRPSSRIDSAISSPLRELSASPLPQESPDPECDPQRIGRVLFSKGRESMEGAMWATGIMGFGGVLAVKAASFAPGFNIAGIAAGAMVSLQGARMLYNLIRTGEISWSKR